MKYICENCDMESNSIRDGLCPVCERMLENEEREEEE
jgi:predicted amidophosphoribosyltransferase